MLTLPHSIHVLLFSNVVLLSSGVLYLVSYVPPKTPDRQGDPTSELSARTQPPPFPVTAEGVPLSESLHTRQTAIGIVFSTLAIILASLLALALLNRPLDPPHTLLVNNRYIRMAPRAGAVVLCAALTAVNWSYSLTPLGVCCIVVWAVLNWEWCAGMETNGGLIEGVKSTYWG